MSDSPLLSALVWMRAAQGEEGATLASPPDMAQQRASVEFFRSRGFEVTSPQTGQFSIIGTRELFEQTFGDELDVREEDGVIKEVTVGHGGRELTLTRLPEDIRLGIRVVTFSEPLDFGPPSH